MKSLKIGEVVVWHSAAGILCGTIVGMDIRTNADNKLHPWIVIEESVNAKKISMPADDGYLKMMKFSKLERA